MSEKEKSALATEEKDPIFRLRALLVGLILFGINLGLVIGYDKVSAFCWSRVPDGICRWIAAQSFEGLYDTQINLIMTGIATLSIITSLMDIRYLGMNYKGLFFKDSPSWFTPQEIILLMVVNQIGGLLSGVSANALASFVICWGLFLYLLYQIYVYVIKVSRVFRKIRRRLIRSCEWNMKSQMCDRIYNKVIRITYTDKRNSYLFEEIEVILQMLVTYRDYGNLYKDSGKKIKGLKRMVMRLVKNEAYVRCGQYACLIDKQQYKKLNKKQKSEIREVSQSLVNKIIKAGDKISNRLSNVSTDKNKPAQQALREALDAWCGR